MWDFEDADVKSDLDFFVRCFSALSSLRITSLKYVCLCKSIKLDSVASVLWKEFESCENFFVSARFRKWNCRPLFRLCSCRDFVDFQELACLLCRFLAFSVISRVGSPVCLRIVPLFMDELHFMPTKNVDFVQF